MPITYTWTATSLIGYPVIDGETDVVTRACYTVLADDGEGHTADYSNFAYTPLDPSVPFIPYADLTNDIVIGWVQNVIGPDAIAAIQGSLAILFITNKIKIPTGISNEIEENKRLKKKLTDILSKQ